MSRRPLVYLTDPGFRQEPRQIAAALSERRLPFLFRTSAYVSPASRLGRLPTTLPECLSRRLERRWRARYQPEIDSGAVSSCYFPDILGRVLLRTPLSLAATYLVVNSSFDRYAAARLPTGTSLVVAMQGSALATVRRSRRIGAKAIVVANTPDALAETLLVAEEERRLGIRPTAAPARFQVALCDRIRRELAEADLVLCNSDFTRRDLVRHGLDAEAVRAVPLGVDIGLFRPREPTTSRRPAARAVYVGGVHARKGVVHLARAVEFVRRSGEAVEAHAYGPVDPRYAPVLAPHLESGALTLHGPVPHHLLADVYSEADVFVLPTLSDGFGLVAYEAMACGVPTIVTDRCGVDVTHGEEALVVPHGDATALGETIGRILGDDTLAATLAREGLRLARARAWPRYRARAAELLVEALGETPGAGAATGPTLLSGVAERGEWR